MTPDEALRCARDLWDGRLAFGSGADMMHHIDRIAAALLAAVAEERAACIALADAERKAGADGRTRDGKRLPLSMQYYADGRAAAAEGIAAGIRKRGG